MHQEVAVIAQDPLALIVTFDAGRFFAALLQLQVDFVGNGLVLARTRPGADHKVIRETGHAGEIQNNDVRGFFLARRPNGNAPPGFGWGRKKICISTIEDFGIAMRQKHAPIVIVLASRAIVLYK